MAAIFVPFHFQSPPFLKTESNFKFLLTEVTLDPEKMMGNKNFKYS